MNDGRVCAVSRIRDFVLAIGAIRNVDEAPYLRLPYGC